MNHSEGDERAFYQRQATRILALADTCKGPRIAERLLKAAEYYVQKLEERPTKDRGQ